MHRDGPEDDDHPEAPQERHLAFQVRLASGELDSSRLVLWRGAPHPGGDVETPAEPAFFFWKGSRVIAEAGGVSSPLHEVPPPNSPVNPPPAVDSLGCLRPPHLK